LFSEKYFDGVQKCEQKDGKKKIKYYQGSKKESKGLLESSFSQTGAA
jgi:hypothetical protein